MLEAATNKGAAPFTKEEMTAYAAESVTRYKRTEVEFLLLNAKLYYVLISLTDKGAYTTVDAIDDFNGMEAWRRLSERYARTKRQKSVMALATLMNMSLPDDHTLESKFSQFENELDRYEKGDR